MKKQIVLMLLMMTLVGCGPGPAWYQYGKTLEEAAADCRECDQRTLHESTARYYDEMRDSQVTGIPTTPTKLQEMHYSQDFDNCMRGKGYRMTKPEWLPKDIKRCHVTSANQSSHTVAGK